jgi:hypothetical protein
MHHYWGFGLNILSEIEFPELLPSRFEHHDVTITLGGIPSRVLELSSADTDTEFIISDQEYFLDIKNACKYYVREGSEVFIAPYDNVEGRSVRIYLLATVMAVVLLQRGLMPLHASGIIKDNKLILFTGDSGAGKSTTLAHLVARGYRIFTDDVCVLRVSPQNQEIVEGIASYPMIKLWDDAISKLDNDSFSSRSFRVKPDADKYGYFFYDTFIKEPYPIDKIFILKAGDQETKPDSRRLTGIEAFRLLEKQAYRNYLITNQFLRELHFKTMSLLSRSAIIYEMSRPGNGTVEQLGDALEELF